MEKIKEFLAQQEAEMKIKQERVSKLKAPETPHEYVILNNAWIKGEQNILDKLKKVIE
jgi:hypothetical protein